MPLGFCNYNIPSAICGLSIRASASSIYCISAELNVCVCTILSWDHAGTDQTDAEQEVGCCEEAHDTHFSLCCVVEDEMGSEEARVVVDSRK